MSKMDDPRIELQALLHSTNETIQRAVKLELAQYHISQSQVLILHMLVKKSDMLTLNQLAESSTKELNSVTTLIDRMQKNELVKKVKNEGENKTYVALTEKGRDLYNNTITEHAIMLIFDILTEPEKEQLTGLLEKLRGHARSLLGLDYVPPFLQKAIDISSFHD